MSESLKLHIAQVFRAEVAEAGFNHVSVVQLMKKSGIRRQTFYDNFQDKYDLLTYTIQAMMEKDIEKNIGCLKWEEIIFQVFYSVEVNKDFYKSVYESQKEVDVVGEISRHIAVLLQKIVEDEGAACRQQAGDFVEVFSIGLTYTMIDNLFKLRPLESDVIADKVNNALHFTLKTQ
ncbi:dihydroxyacetone kinase transcriptional activator DhaS [Lactobacillus nasalidis]|uniref:Dihydroxyacetone kinase transcriptional activator DhaS n=1 Tax=Lactobacillus nasalidis TaxID=2797258 RepID=A0ABQ3W930_9LACO|nr:TetR/AcrR family transcriptional regulator C-terminal domain-containing protein [Lactobacillus nasalidis]GHV97205.1 dihydroxyacetone kinase transcriptional activator DhaS [Lactobacillus nasalidis]GHV98726.1 dihydroxyacetone kinase transcriptional activator DhaS [Lactobacillus nasalidis]GHW02172.1 dihydroxyacetone kinase transcriptional activator DhaS [Lactobacillus nasalidis]